MITIASKGVLQEGELQSYAGLGPRQKPFANSCTRLAAQGAIKVDRSVPEHAWPGAQHVAPYLLHDLIARRNHHRNVERV